MATEKDERSAAPAKTAGAAGEDVGKRASSSQEGKETSSQERKEAGTEKPVALGPAIRREQFLIGVRAVSTATPSIPRQSIDAVAEYLSRQENISIVKRIKLGGSQPFAMNGGANEVIVARMDENKADHLRVAAQQQLIVEHDALLKGADLIAAPIQLAPPSAILPLRSNGTEIAVRVVGEQDQPVPKASVMVYGPDIPAQAITDDGGNARVMLFGAAMDSIRAICVRPTSSFWDRFIPSPKLNESGVTTIKLRSLTESFPDFPHERLLGWGERLMRLDQFGNTFSGKGVRLGIIDSGCDNAHPQLRHVTRGKDFTGSEAKWTNDALSYGTHCAGIINASNSGPGIQSFAPDAEVHVLKVLPGGRTSDLLAALDECIARELDVVSIHVGSDEPSELVNQKLHEARQKGIACIAAAGNSGGPVQFPALLPTVLAVGAVGKANEFPPDSCSHAYSVVAPLVGANGVFAAGFSCYGPQIAVSAPGVACVSTVPGGGYAPADGTSVAAAHVSGFAALVLAHHPLFLGALKARTEQRVSALFGLIASSAVLHFPDLLHGGAGVPDLTRVPGEQAISAALSAPAFSPFGFEQMPAGIGTWNALMRMRASGMLL